MELVRAFGGSPEALEKGLAISLNTGGSSTLIPTPEPQGALGLGIGVSVTTTELADLKQAIHELSRAIEEQPRTVHVHNNNVKNTYPDRRAQQAQIRNGQNDLLRREGNR